jgi:uncharacterized tellurite resistance protein B-like protein
LREAIAKMVATDGFNFNQIANSKTLRKAMKADGHEIPKSHTRVRQLFMKQFEKTKEEVKNKILKYVKDGLRFAVSFDESTSVRNRR